MLILIAGPYRSGTNDEPDRLAANLAFLESAAWPIFNAGHIPMIGEEAARLARFYAERTDKQAALKEFTFKDVSPAALDAFESFFNSR